VLFRSLLGQGAEGARNKSLADLMVKKIAESKAAAAANEKAADEAKDGNVDALPTVLLESLASGCPSVSTRLSGIPEIIEDGVSGLLVQPDDETQLADALQRTLVDPTLAADLAKGGRLRAQERFDVRVNVGQMRSRFEQVLSGGNAAGEAISNANTTTGAETFVSPQQEAA